MTVELTNFSADHRRLLSGSWFEAGVIADGKSSGRLTGFLLYSANSIVVNDPIRRKQHRLTLRDYDDFEGDFEQYLTHLLTELP